MLPLVVVGVCDRFERGLTSKAPAAAADSLQGRREAGSYAMPSGTQSTHREAKEDAEHDEPHHEKGHIACQRGARGTTA